MPEPARERRSEHCRLFFRLLPPMANASGAHAVTDLARPHTHRIGTILSPSLEDVR